MLIHINGNILDAEQARLSPFEHGFMYGLGLFETFRVYEGHPFLLDDHIERLQQGLQWLNISYTLDRERVKTEVEELLNANHLSNAYVRYNVSAGEGPLGLMTRDYEEPTTIIYMKPLGHPPSHPKKKAKILRIPRNTPEASIRLKSHHYLNSILGKREVGDDSDVEGLFLTASGDLAEGVVSNLFWVKNKTVYTPAEETGILNGITRQFVLKLVQKNGWRTKEGVFSLDELKQADEAFLTNSIQEVVSLQAVDSTVFPAVKENGLPSVVEWLQNEYAKYRTSLWSRHQL